MLVNMMWTCHSVICIKRKFDDDDDDAAAADDDDDDDDEQISLKDLFYHS